jgi:hypothetical protein
MCKTDKYDGFVLPPASLIVLASLLSLHWRHHPCHAGICLLVTLSLLLLWYVALSQYRLLMTLLLHVALLFGWLYFFAQPCCCKHHCCCCLWQSTQICHAPLPLLRTALAWAMPDIKDPCLFFATFALPPLLPYTASVPFWCR